MLAGGHAPADHDTGSESMSVQVYHDGATVDNAGGFQLPHVDVVHATRPAGERTGQYERLRWVLSQEVSAVAKLCLVSLSYHADAVTLRCWPGQETLASETGLSLRSVVRGVSELEAGGLLKVRRRRRGANSYRILMCHSGTSKVTGRHTEPTLEPRVDRAQQVNTFRNKNVCCGGCGERGKVKGQPCPNCGFTDFTDSPQGLAFEASRRLG